MGVETSSLGKARQSAGAGPAFGFGAEPYGADQTPNLSPARKAELADSLTSFVERQDFPCVGAKSAMAQGQLRIETAWSITSAWNDLCIQQALTGWSRDYTGEATGFRSLAVVFSGPRDLDEREFEEALWERLRSLIAKDGWRGHDYDPKVSSDPEDPHFSLSFGGQAYFAVGMHPHASRKARRMDYPTIVFNLHDQFERLRAEQKYERMRQTILARDKKFNGSINPMLSRHGETSEARQYSGRQFEGEWKCPFSKADRP